MASLPDIAKSERPEDARRLLMDTVRNLALSHYFSRAVLKSADALAARSHDWEKPLAWFQPEGSHADALQCSVVDTDGVRRVATAYVYSQFGQAVLESDCSCAQPRCPHVAAMLIRLQQLLDWPHAMTPLQRWQESIEAIPERSRMASTADGERAWSAICLLHADRHGQPSTLLARLVLSKDGDALQEPEQWLAVDESTAQAHMSPRALMWQAQLEWKQKSAAADGRGYLLQGRRGARLLQEFLRAGICRSADTFREIRLGEARSPQWHWLRDGQGRACIELAWPAADDAQLIELAGLHYLDETSGELGPMKLTDATWQMLARMPPVPPTEVAGLAAGWPPHPLLSAVPPPPPSPPLRDVEAPLQLIAVLGASRHRQAGDHVFHVHAFADYAGVRLPLAEDGHAHDVIRLVGMNYVHVRRDIEAEALAWRGIEEAGFVNLSALLPDGRHLLDPAPDTRTLAHRLDFRGGAETFTALEARLQALAPLGYALEYDPDLPFAVLPSATPLRATLEKGGRPGWTQFELATTIDGEEIDVLPIVLGGLARHEFPLVAPPGEPPGAHWLAPIGFQRWLPLSLAQVREWIAPLAECLDRAPDPAATHLDLSRSQAMALGDTLLTQGIPVDGALGTSITDTLAMLRAAMGSATDTVQPTSFQGTLRHYQREGVQWLQALRQSRLGGVLVDDMGLGKTVQVIAHLLLEQECGRLEHPALIVAPTSLVFNWLDEIARFAPTLQCLNFTGPNRSLLYARLAQVQVVVTSYALVANELAQLEGIDYSMLVLDEAQWIKNPMTHTARAVRRLRAEHRIAVTGTPVENHLGELWAHFDAVLPGYLGDYRSFNRSFRKPIERGQDDARRAILRQRIAPFLLRRSKAVVAPELPPKTETVLRVAMGERQRQLYESLRLAQSELVRKALASYRAEQSHIVVLSALLRLRQVCCDPRLVNASPDPPESAKLEALLELIRALRDDGRRILVFSQFTSMLALITARLDSAGFAHEVLTGETSDRAAPVRHFQSGDVPILLASLKAGGVGLNLTAADAVVHYDPWWNPAVELQAVDRAHRLGREDPVFVYKLICEDSIEEKIENMKFDKSDLAGAMLDNTASPLSRLDEMDLQKLFELPTSVR